MGLSVPAHLIRLVYRRRRKPNGITKANRNARRSNDPRLFALRPLLLLHKSSFFASAGVLSNGPEKRVLSTGCSILRVLGCYDFPLRHDVQKVRKIGGRNMEGKAAAFRRHARSMTKPPMEETEQICFHVTAAFVEKI